MILIGLPSVRQSACQVGVSQTRMLAYPGSSLPLLGAYPLVSFKYASINSLTNFKASVAIVGYRKTSNSCACSMRPVFP